MLGLLLAAAAVAFGAQVTDADEAGAFGKNMSGLYYQGGGVLWAVRNSPSRLYRLTAQDGRFAGSATTLTYPDGRGAPDAEAVTMADSTALYVAAERDGNGPNRFSVLRYLPGSGVATHEWNLTADLPKAPSNAGPEGLAWVPDSQLGGLIDDNTGQPYDPARYPGHGTGLFLVGLEDDGRVYVYALFEKDAAFRRITSFASGHPRLADLFYDADQRVLWAWCDDHCGNRAQLLTLQAGRFTVRQAVERPAALPDSNHEGIAIAPERECAGGRRAFFWADDDRLGKHALRRGSVPCGPAF